MKSKLSDKIFFNSLCSIMLLGLIVTYSNHFNNPFQFDDDHTIVNNVWIRSLKNIPKFFVDGATSSSLPQNQGYRPGVTTLNTIDYYIAKKNPFNIAINPEYIATPGLIPFYFHLSIFISFVFQLILMYFLFKKIIDQIVKNKWNKYFALFIVAFYGFHTSLAETNNYIISRSDSFSSLMVVLSFVIYVYFPAKRKYLLYLIPYIFGFFVKETALMFAPLLFIYIILFDKHIDLTKLFSKGNGKKLINSFVTIIPAILLGVASFILSTMLTSKTTLRAIISPVDYLKTQPFVMVQYFKTIFLPTELSADTDWGPLSTIFDLKLLMGLMFITGMIILAFRASRKAETLPISFGIFWFFIALLPSSSIFALSEVLNDHRIFYPYIGLAFSLVWAIIYFIFIKNEKRINATPALKYVVIALSFIIIFSHAYGEHQRNKVWSSYETLWYDVTKKSPNNGRGLMNYGLSQMRKGNYTLAKTYFEKALVLLPNYSLLFINLGVLHTSLNDPIGAEQYYKRAISTGMYVDQSYAYYGTFLYNQKRYDEAIVMLKNAIANNQASTYPRMTLLAVYYDIQDWGNLKDLAEETLNYLPNDHTCLSYIDAAKNKKSKIDIALENATKNPCPENYINLSLFYYEEARYNECIDACKNALKLKPDYALAYNNMCSAYNALKLFDKAIEAGKKAVALQPDLEIAKNNLKFAESQKK